MSQAKIRLLEDRVLQAVARVRSLGEERDRAEGELRGLRRRLEELEEELVCLRHGLPPAAVDDVRGVLEAAVRELREEEGAAAAQAEEPSAGGA
jgi:predicted nuclease with TOPRIM domain